MRVSASVLALAIPLLSAAPLLMALPAAAQAPLTCSAANLGQSVCQAEGVCRCAYNPGGLMIREPAGYRWDCSPLNGKCSAGSSFPVLAREIQAAPGVGVAPLTGKAQVRAVQQELKRQGFDPGAADGVAGRRTQTAIRDYQRARNLPVSGRVDPALLESMRLAAPAR